MIHCGSDGKESACNVGDLGWEDPWRREWLPTPVFWPGEFHGLYIVHGVAKSRTRLSDFHFQSYSPHGLLLGYAIISIIIFLTFFFRWSIAS